MSHCDGSVTSTHCGAGAASASGTTKKKGKKKKRDTHMEVDARVDGGYTALVNVHLLDRLDLVCVQLLKPIHGREVYLRTFCCGVITHTFVSDFVK